MDDIFLKLHGVPLKSPFSRKSVKQAHLFSFSIVSSKWLLALQGITWLRSEWLSVFFVFFKCVC